MLLPPLDAGAMSADYVQNHVIDGVYPSGGPHSIERDLFTEIWFDDFAALEASTATPYYLANLKPDEPRFVDDATVVRMLVRPEVLMEGVQADHKLFLLCGSGEQSDDFGTGLKRLAGLTALTANHVLPQPDGSQPFADIVFECWFASAQDARNGLDVAATMLTTVAHRSLALLADEYSSQRLRQLYLS